jgi:hypothetical protein
VEEQTTHSNDEDPVEDNGGINTDDNNVRDHQPIINSLLVWLVAGGWWLVLICCERKVLLAGCWWLILF